MAAYSLSFYKQKNLTIYHQITKTMKKNFYLAAVPAMMLAAAAFGLAGCEDINNETPGTDDPGTETPAETPVLTIETESPMSVTADAASYNFTYTIENAVEGAQVSATCPETWITGIDVETEGSVGFSVTANDGESRTAEITVTYAWGDGESEKTEKSISIEQAAAPAEDPAVTLNPATLEQFPASSEDITELTATVEITVENEVQGGTLSTSSSDASWAHVSDPVDGQMEISIDPNNGPVRNATITVTYTYGDNQTKTATIEVSQAAAALPTEITVVGMEGNTIQISSEGITDILQFSVDNGVEGGVFLASANSDGNWIIVDNDLISQMNDRAGFMYYTIEANDTQETRSGTLTIVYTYNTDQTVTKVLTIEQEAGGTTPPDTGDADYNFTAARFSGMNWGTDSSDDGSYLYNVNLTSASDAETTFNYSIGFYSNTAGAPVGHFIFDSEGINYVNGYIDYFSSMSVNSEPFEIASGTADITNNNDGTYTYVLDLVDSRGNTHHVTYTGPVSF